MMILLLEMEVLIYLLGLDEYNLELRLRENLASSIAYTLKKIKVENTAKVQYNALKRESVVENNKKQTGGNEYGTDIQTGRRLSDTESGDGPGAGGNTYEVRDAEGNIPEGTPSGTLYREAPGRETDGALSYDTASGRGESRQTDRTDDEVGRRDRGAEGSRPDGVGTQNELNSEQGGRDSSFGDSLQPLDEIEYVQLSLFPTSA
jgi:hypothetical protein